MKSRFARLAPILSALAVAALAQNAATTVSIDANAARHPISPNIYGVCYGDAHDMAALNAPLNRWGGNATTRYNWQIDAHSAAADWYFETYSDGSGTPGGSAETFVATSRSAGNGAEPLFTIPMIDYLASLGPGRTTLEGFSVKKYGAQTAVDPWNADAGNGVSTATGTNITGNDPLDTGVANSTAIQQAWVQHFIGTYGAASTSSGIKYYILDNEPSLWNSTHRDVHPSPLGYDELFTKIVAYANAIRAVEPNAKIAGPEEWGWWAMYYSGVDQAGGLNAAGSDYNTHGHTYYYPWLLQQLAAYKQQTGRQLIDILTVHAYNGAPAGNDDSASGQQYRNRETRILWDPSFSDPSWYGDIGVNGRIVNYIPTLKAMVAQYCPGLQLGFTEYNWGDEPNLNGATTQADVLGIYGREGVDLATRWTVAKNTNTTPTTYYVTYLASQIYRNYDGLNSTFGDTSVSATVANPDNLSAFAALRSNDGALTVMVINKQQGSTAVTVNLANFPSSGSGQAWQINSAAQATIARLADVPVSGNAINATVPSQSITLFVIPSGTVNTLKLNSTTFPAVALPRAPISFTCNVTNTGTNAWGANHYLVLRDAALVQSDPSSAAANLAFGSLLGVAPGASTTVNLSFTAPSSPGPHKYSLQGLENGVAWFNAFAPETLTVGALPPDFDGDGTADILWSNTATGDRAIWFMNGTAIGSFGYLAGIPTDWHIVGTGDFNNDAQTDILWENTRTGDRSIWLMNGTSISSFAYLAYVDPVWHIAAVGDFNGDGQPDLLWENAMTGDRAIWFMNGTAIAGFGYLAGIPTDWHIVGTGDFNADGQTDIVWENISTGDRSIWLMNGTAISSFAYVANVNPVWHIAMVADFNGDGQPDLLWENAMTGDRAFWLMNGTGQGTAPYLSYVDPVWRIAP